MAEETPLFKVTIDNETIEVPAGTTILQAARMIGKEVAPPAMCYYGKLENTGGNCRTCLVEVSKGSEADPRPMPKLVPSCRTTVMDGMVVGNKTSERTVEARKGIVELLLINHPLDCFLRPFFDHCPRKGAFFRKFVEGRSNKGRTMVEQE